MSERKDGKWLDEQLRRAVNGSTPAFDAQAWKRRYSGEFQALLRRREQSSRTRRDGTVRLVLRSSLARFAIAAAIVVVGGILVVGRFQHAPGEPMTGPQLAAGQSPAQMISITSLSAAFRSGGMEELDKQCDRALERLGPRPTIVSVQELLKDINGKG